jgi:hypothetical protein
MAARKNDSGERGESLLVNSQGLAKGGKDRSLRRLLQWIGVPLQALPQAAIF